MLFVATLLLITASLYYYTLHDDITQSQKHITDMFNIGQSNIIAIQCGCIKLTARAIRTSGQCREVCPGKDCPWPHWQYLLVQVSHLNSVATARF